MLVIRASVGEIRWIDVSTYLKHENAGGNSVRQIVFKGKRLDVMSVRWWRLLLVGGSLQKWQGRGSMDDRWVEAVQSWEGRMIQSTTSA
jgi:hypothetical protein